MSPLDTASLDTDTPQTTDGRQYPEHLRAYHKLDADLLPKLAEMAPATFDDLSIAVDDPQIRAALPHWLASAQWRGLIARANTSAGSPRTYVLGPKAQTHLASAA
jgi:hypothetical protein